MNYLQASEYETFGLEQATPAAWITAASALMDTYCRRATLGVAQYSERLRVTSGRATVRLSYLPLSAVAPATSPVVSARVRYGEARRGEMYNFAELASDVARAFSLPGTWTDLDPASFDAFADTGEITLPANPLGLAFNEVEITYNAGLAVLPSSVKTACAQIVRNAQATPALTVQRSRIDTMQMMYFADSLLDADVRRMLAPWVAQKVG